MWKPGPKIAAWSLGGLALPWQRASAVSVPFGRGQMDALGGAAPTRPVMAGDGRAVQRETLKASDQSLRLVSTPRLPWLSQGARCGKRKPKRPK